MTRLSTHFTLAGLTATQHRTDGTRAGGICVYHKEVGAWVALGI